MSVRIILVSLVFLGTGISWPGLLGQDVEVSDPRIQLQGNVFHIRYDILNSSPSERYTIRLEVSNAQGDPIRATSLEGDVGEDVTGGANKLITWDLEKDGIFLSEEIFFELYATFTYTPPAGTTGPATESQKTYTRTGLMLQSLAFPGLGLTRISDKPHWIRGVAGYGCLAGSVIFNLKARNTYQLIGDYPAFGDKMELFDRSVMEDNVSDVLGYLAIGIWITDFFWTRAGTKHLSKKNMQGQQGGLRIDPGYDPVTGSALLSFTYRF